MKKLLLALAFINILVFPINAMANFFIDPTFVYWHSWTTNTGGTGLTNDYGGFLGLGGNVHRDVNLIGRFGYVAGTGEYEGASGTFSWSGTSKQNYIILSMGVEYVPFFPILFENRTKWKTSLYTGFIRIDSTGKDDNTNASGTTKDNGLLLSISTGLEFIISQRISPYFDIGYQKSFFFKDLEKLNTNSLFITIGFRIYIYMNKDLGYYY